MCGTLGKDLLAIRNKYLYIYTGVHAILYSWLRIVLILGRNQILHAF